MGINELELAEKLRKKGHCVWVDLDMEKHFFKILRNFVYFNDGIY